MAESGGARTTKVDHTTSVETSINGSQFLMKHTPVHSDGDGCTYTISQAIPFPLDNSPEWNRDSSWQSEGRDSGANKVNGGKGGSSMDDLHARVTQLERDVGDIRVKATSIEGKIDRISDKLDNVVTKNQLYGSVILALVATLTSILGGGWWLAREFLSPIIAQLGS
ncbi:hypothetical protein [Salinicola socius]|nr:hypothetical protein [Salinicola socius]